LFQPIVLLQPVRSAFTAIAELLVGPCTQHVHFYIFLAVRLADDLNQFTSVLQCVCSQNCSVSYLVDKQLYLEEHTATERFYQTSDRIIRFVVNATTKKSYVEMPQNINRWQVKQDSLLLLIGVCAIFFYGGLRHLCPKNFSTTPEKKPMLSYKTTLPDSPHPVIVSKNPGFWALFSLDGMNSVFCLINIKISIFSILAAGFCPKNLTFAQKIMVLPPGSSLCYCCLYNLVSLPPLHFSLSPSSH